jgi:hypothetical protein
MVNCLLAQHGSDSTGQKEKLLKDHSWEHFLRTLSAMLFNNSANDALDLLYSDGCKKINKKASDVKKLISQPGWQTNTSALNQANIPTHLIKYMSKNPLDGNCLAYVTCLLDEELFYLNNEIPEQ